VVVVVLYAVTRRHGGMQLDRSQRIARKPID